MKYFKNSSETNQGYWNISKIVIKQRKIIEILQKLKTKKKLLKYFKNNFSANEETDKNSRLISKENKPSVIFQK